MSASKKLDQVLARVDETIFEVEEQCNGDRIFDTVEGAQIESLANAVAALADATQALARAVRDR